MFEDDSLHSRSCGSKSYPCLIDLNQTSAQPQRKPALSRTPDTNPVTEPARQKRWILSAYLTPVRMSGFARLEPSGKGGTVLDGF